MEVFDNRYAPDEEMYPASNGGYYNRNVYSEKYFQGHPNALKFYELASSEKAKKAQIRYNQNIENDRLQTDKNSKEDVTQSLIGRNYLRKNSESETTYRAFGVDESDDENYDEDGYDELQAMKLQRQRSQHQYERPNFDGDNTRTIGRLSSFRHGHPSATSAGAPTSSAPPPPPNPRVDSITR